MTEEMIIFRKKVDILNQNYKKYKNNNEIDDLELKECVYDVLSWFELCTKNISFKKEHTGIISAMRHANNSKKHSTTLYKCTLMTPGLYPGDTTYPSSTTFPSKFEIFWGTLPADEKYHNQLQKYNYYLKHKELIPSINNVFAIVQSYYV